MQWGQLQFDDTELIYICWSYMVGLPLLTLDCPFSTILYLCFISFHKYYHGMSLCSWMLLFLNHLPRSLLVVFQAHPGHISNNGRLWPIPCTFECNKRLMIGKQMMLKTGRSHMEVNRLGGGCHNQHQPSSLHGFKNTGDLRMVRVG